MAPRHALIVLHVESDSGPQRSLAPRLARLRDDGWRWTFLVPADGPAAEAARELGEVRTGVPGALTLPVSPAGLLAQARAQRAQARAVEGAARETGSGVVIVSAPVMLGALTGARRAGAATLLYAGEILSRPGVRGLAGRAVTRIAARRAGAVVAASNEVAKAYAGRGAAVSVVHPVIPPPPPAAELARLGGELRAALGVAADERVVACLGALTEGRGQRVLIEALARSRGRGHAPGWSVVIGGAAYERAPDRAYERRLRELVDELGLGGSVRFAGRVADPHALYAAADVFANPALVPEGFGRAACEALSCGCPVVSSTGGGVGEALADGETALLVEPGSAEALAAAIERLLGDRELAGRLAGAGAEDVARRLSPEAGQAEFERALEAALAVRAASEPTSP